MPRKIITEELKQEIIKFYLTQPMTYAVVQEKYNLSAPTVGKILSEIPKYSKAKIKNPNLKERFFETIDSEEKAYFLGLLISDGNVYKDNTGRQASISITLNLEDEYMLQKFLEVLNANTIIGKDGRGSGQSAVRSNLMAQDLEQYGVIPRKSYYTYLPKNIPKNLMPHLIRGIFDGDGSILAKINSKDNRYLHSFSFCGTHQLMTDISQYCFTILNLKQIPKVYDYKDRELSEIKIQNLEDMLKFGNWIYENASIYLVRKKKKFDEFLLYIKNKVIPS